MSTGIGGKLRSQRTTAEWLTPLGPDAYRIAERWHFPLPDLGGTSVGGGDDAGTLAAGAGPAGVGGGSWASLMGALGYGYGLQYFAIVEGIPTVLNEAAADFIAPAGYDHIPALVIDRSARLGSSVEGDSHIAKGYDHELRVLDTPTVRTYMRRPARVTTLTADLGANDTIAYAGNAFGIFRGLSEFYIGASCIPCGGIQGNAFLALDRDAYGRRRSYRKGTLITDGPYEWQGRRVDVFAILVDPSGRYVQGATCMTNSCMVFSGYIAERPVRDGTEWVMTVRDQVRRLADPIGVSASGSAVWSVDDDTLVLVPHELTFNFEYELVVTGSILSVSIAPFSALPTHARKSELRAAIITALDAAATSASVNGFGWRSFRSGDDKLVWELVMRFTCGAGDTTCTLVTAGVTPNGAAGFFQQGEYGDSDRPCVPFAGEERRLGVWQFNEIHGVALGVLLDDGEPSQIPTSGHVVIEAAGRVDYARYTDLLADDTDPMRVNLILDSADRISGPDLDDVLAGNQSTASVRFLWSDLGTLADILRRAIVSTGDAQHGFWDQLPKGQGLGLPFVDLDSFASVFGGPIADLAFQIAADSGTSIGELFDGFLRLSRRALVTRRRPDGASVEIAAVDLGPIDSTVPVSTITDAMLVTRQGRRPVRVKSAYTAPQTIQVTCRTIPAGDLPAGEGAITYRDKHLVDWTGTKWDLDVHGLAREDILTLGTGWATSWFRAGETRQIIELDVPPTVLAQVGDVVALDIVDATLWDYALGTLRRESDVPWLGRVLGALFELKTAIVTLTVAVDGIFGAGPMAPSLPIVERGGTSTAPTFFDVAAEHYDRLVRAKGANATWKILAYERGEDHGRAEYTVSTVTLPGGGVARLTVTAYPSPAITMPLTGWRLTWPIAANATEDQARHLNNTDGTQWG